MREGNTLSWLLGDHLGSTSITANASGARTGEVRYRPWGEDRYTWGTTPTSYRYTGQRSEMGSIGLYFYNARFYDPYLNRWIQPDVIIPGDGDSYTPLIVDYHETQFLEQLNQENRERLGGSQSRSPSLPLNSLTFDRFSYALNNPVKAVDPTGHWPSISKLLSIAATICDLTATGISVSGVILEGVAAMGGEIVTPFLVQMAQLG